MSFKIEGPLFEKSDVCTSILRSLPDWFGIEEAIVHYSEEINHLPTWVAYEENEVVGFISIKQHNPFSAEVYVMGILRKSHRKGIGRALMEQSQIWLRTQQVEYLQVKTLGPSDPDEQYMKTRLFYNSIGFKPLEETSKIWNEENPCLIMVKKI